MRKSNLKRIGKLILALCYLPLAEIGDFVLRLCGRPRARCTVLYYHSIDSRDRSRFARQVDVLLRHTTPVAADLRTPLPPGRRYSVVTFDDGFQNVIDNAMPELEKRQIPWTFFVIADALGKTVAWSTRETSTGELHKIMSEDQLRRLDSKLLTIGAHTMTHPRLTSLAADEAMWEIKESKIRLESILGREIALFSFPYGAFSQPLIRQCEEAGFQRIFTTLPGFALSMPTEFVSSRVGTEVTDWPLEFQLKVLGAYNWLPMAFVAKRKLRGWLTFKAQRVQSRREAQS